MSYSIKLWKVHGNGNIGWWKATVQKDEIGVVHLYTESCNKEGGKVVPHLSPVTGKNTGRANETSDWDQAVSEMMSKGRKKQDNGYTPIMPKPGDIATNTLGFVKCQKALKYGDLSENQLENIDWDNAYVQRKYDGHKCMSGDNLLYTSGGKEILTVDHITHNTGLPLDGELYVHGLTLREIGKLIKKYRPGETEKVQYVVYDQVSAEPFAKRLREVWAAAQATPHKNILVAETYQVFSWDDVFDCHRQFKADGYEGTILRQGTEPYKSGSRCSDVIKIKDMDDAEFEVVDVIKGKPKLYKGVMLDQAVFVLKTADGQKFNSLAHGTLPKKAQYLVCPPKWVGKMLTVRFFGLTDFGIPNIAVAKGFREDL